MHEEARHRGDLGCSSSLHSQERQTLLDAGPALRRAYGNVQVCDAADAKAIVEAGWREEVRRRLAFINTGTEACTMASEADVHLHADRLPRGEDEDVGGGPFDACAVYCDDSDCTEGAAFLTRESEWVRAHCHRVAYLADGFRGYQRANLPVPDACRRHLGASR